MSNHCWESAFPKKAGNREIIAGGCTSCDCMDTWQDAHNMAWFRKLSCIANLKAFWVHICFSAIAFGKKPAAPFILAAGTEVVTRFKLQGGTIANESGRLTVSTKGPCSNYIGRSSLSLLSLRCCISLIAVPCREPFAVFDDGLWSMLSKAPTVYVPRHKFGGQTTASV